MKKFALPILAVITLVLMVAWMAGLFVEKTLKCRLQMDERLLRCVLCNLMGPRILLSLDRVESFLEL